MIATVKTAISGFGPTPRALDLSSALFLDEDLASIPASRIPDEFRKLTGFLPVIVASVAHGRNTNLPRVWRNSSCRYASRTSSRAKTPAIGTSSSHRTTRSARIFYLALRKSGDEFGKATLEWTNS
jgi:hypothetical protein